MTSEPGSMGRVRLIAERPAENDLAEQLGSSGALNIQAEPAAAPSRQSSGHYHDQMLATLTAAAAILNARILGLVAVVASFVLALIAVKDPSDLRLYINIAFDLGVVAPITWLYLCKG